MRRSYSVWTQPIRIEVTPHLPPSGRETRKTQRGAGRGQEEEALQALNDVGNSRCACNHTYIDERPHDPKFSLKWT